MFKQAASAIKHLHAWGWAHRDVKPEHLVISHAPAAAATALAPPSVAQLHIRLVDFGEACQCSSGYTTMYGFHGTPLYMAPEVAAWYGFDVNDHDAVHPPRYGTACDLWSLGMTLYVMLTGEAPWDQDSPDLGVLVAAIQGGQPKLASRAWDKVSEGAKALSRALLVLQPQCRISAAEACEDPWAAQTLDTSPIASVSTCVGASPSAPTSTSTTACTSPTTNSLAIAAAAAVTSSYGSAIEDAISYTASSPFPASFAVSAVPLANPEVLPPMPPLSREASRQETPDATPTEDVNSAHLDAELSSLRAELNRRRESEAAALRRANVAEAQADSLLEEMSELEKALAQTTERLQSASDAGFSSVDLKEEWLRGRAAGSEEGYARGSAGAVRAR